MSNFFVGNKARQFDNWTNSKENRQNYEQNKPTTPFKAVDMSGDKPYNIAIKDFAQEYIDLYDTDNSGTWDYDEFFEMAYGTQLDEQIEPFKKFCNDEQLENVRETLKEIHSVRYKEYFEILNLDENTEEINAGEFATMLMLGDLDQEKYKIYGITSDSIDGEIDFAKYNEMGADPNPDWKTERKDFYDYFYAE